MDHVVDDDETRMHLQRSDVGVQLGRSQKIVEGLLQIFNPFTARALGIGMLLCFRKRGNPRVKGVYDKAGGQQSLTQSPKTMTLS